MNSPTFADVVALPPCPICFRTEGKCGFPACPAEGDRRANHLLPMGLHPRDPTVVVLANDAGGFRVSECPSPGILAALIVRGCNSYDALVSERNQFKADAERWKQQGLDEVNVSNRAIALLEDNVLAMQAVVNAASLVVGNDEDHEQDDGDDADAMFKLRAAVLEYRALRKTAKAGS